MFWRKRRQKVFSILCLVFNKIYFHHFRFFGRKCSAMSSVFLSVSTKKVFFSLSFLYFSCFPTRTLAMLFTTVLHSECPNESLLCMCFIFEMIYFALMLNCLRDEMSWDCSRMRKSSFVQKVFKIQPWTTSNRSHRILLINALNLFSLLFFFFFFLLHRIKTIFTSEVSVSVVSQLWVEF